MKKNNNNEQQYTIPGMDTPKPDIAKTETDTPKLKTTANSKKITTCLKNWEKPCACGFRIFPIPTGR